MRTLYILGNGFDLHHGLDTRYQHFCFFLQDTNKELYESLITYFGLPDLDRTNPLCFADPQWKYFEEALSKLDTDSVMDRYSDYAADIGSPDFSDREWGAYAREIGWFVDKITKGLFESFRQFIRSVNYPESIENKRVELVSDSLYLNFNYTTTLERYNGILQSSILYLHGKAEDEAHLVLGHGVAPSNFVTKEQEPPTDCTEEVYELWREWMSDQFDYSTELAREELNSYFSDTFKDTDRVIKSNAALFQSLTAVEQVVILGHSLNDVDLPYIEYIAGKVHPDSIWYCSYYEAEEKDHHWYTLTGLGVHPHKLQLLQLTDLLVSQRQQMSIGISE
jgi:hypothetical protein